MIEVFESVKIKFTKHYLDQMIQFNEKSLLKIFGKCSRSWYRKVFEGGSVDVLVF